MLRRAWEATSVCLTLINLANTSSQHLSTESVAGDTSVSLFSQHL